MSYINDALRKAQKDKKLPYATYEPMQLSSGGKIKGSRKWLLLSGISIFLLWVAGTVILLYWPEEKKIPAKAPVMIAQAQSVAPAEPPAVKEKSGVVPAAPQVVKKTTVENAENKDESALKTKTDSGDAQARQENFDSKTLYAQAFKKHQEGNLEEAKELYKKVIKVDPRNVQALNNLGVVYMKKKVYKWAIIRLNDALNIKYNYPDAHYNLACIYAQQNDTNRSLSYLKNAIGFNPEVKKWVENDSDLKVLADIPEFKKILEKK